MKINGLYFITDSGLSKQGIFEDARQAIAGGCRIIQYREKEKCAREMVEEAGKLAEFCGKNNALFIINNNIDVALAVDADGVHLGQDDLPLPIARKLLGKKKIIGLTVHNLEEALKAEKQGADYLSVSPVFETATKKDAGTPVGIDLVQKTKKAVKLPIIAIGGINESNFRQVLAAGADGIAMISAILNSNDTEATVKRILGAMK